MRRGISINRAESGGLETSAYCRFLAGWACVLFSAVLLITLAVQFLLAFRLNVNWDEFNFLSQVHAFLQGEALARLQTLHVHFFFWLPDVATDEVGQIVAGRLVMAALALGSAVLIYGVARRFVSRDAALFGLLIYLAFTTVIQHGASFRTDPLATFLMLLSMFTLLRRDAGEKHVALAGAVMAIAMMVTIKSVFWLAIVPLLIWYMQASLTCRFRRICLFAAGFVPALALLYLGHDATLAERVPVATASALANSGSKMFLLDGLFPRWREFLVVVVLNPLFWVMTVDGAVIAFRAARKGAGREYWLPLVLALPILTPLLYRNAFYYFYVFILPPAAILIGLSYEKHRRRILDRPGGPAAWMFGIVVVAQLVFLAINYGRLLPDRTGPQRETIAAVHQVFPEPVPYIDGFGVVASFPRVGFFMSSWGMDSYRAAGRPVFPDAVAGAQPPLLLADSPSLDAALFPDRDAPEERLLLPADAEFLRENYVPHWGMIFVSGRTLMVPEQGDSAEFSVAVAGEYRLEAAMPVNVDGRELVPGGVISLAAGNHRIEGGPVPAEVTLRWAAAKSPPDSEPVGLLQFFAFDR